MKRLSSLAKTLRACSLLTAALLLLLQLPARALPRPSPDGVSVVASRGARSAHRRQRQWRTTTRPSKKQRRRPAAVSTQGAAATAPDDESAAPGDGAAVKIVVAEIKEEGLAKLLQPEAARRGPLLVNFWATWCEPCRKEFPDLVRIDAEFRPRGLEFITVSIDDVSEIASGVPQFLREMRATRIPAYLLNADNPEKAINMVDNTWRGELPATFLYDREGRLVFKHMGRVNAAELRTAIKKVASDE